MPATAKTRQNIKRLERERPALRLPCTGAKITLPSGPGLLWYAGIGAMAAAELVEWPVALLIAGTHFVENHSHNRDMKELAEGIEAGA